MNNETVQSDTSPDSNSDADESHADLVSSPSSLGSSELTWSDSDESDGIVDDFGNTEAIAYPAINLKNNDDAATPLNNGMSIRFSKNRQ